MLWVVSCMIVMLSSLACKQKGLVVAAEAVVTAKVQHRDILKILIVEVRPELICVNVIETRP